MATRSSPSEPAAVADMAQQSNVRKGTQGGKMTSSKIKPRASVGSTGNRDSANGNDKKSFRHHVNVNS